MKRGAAFSRSASSPPTIKVRVPNSAPFTPPDTGASSIEIFISFAFFETFLETSGFIVDDSITIVFLLIFSSKPSFKNMFSTALSFGNMVIRASIFSVTSEAELLVFIPNSSALCMASFDKSKAFTSISAFKMLFAIGKPIFPKPIKPTFFIFKDPPEDFFPMLSPYAYLTMTV